MPSAGCELFVGGGVLCSRHCHMLGQAETKIFTDFLLISHFQELVMSAKLCCSLTSVTTAGSVQRRYLQ